jgi:NAD(P)-dependent dehydrogenase (short-subunit alcohol dehydrogenase family)
MGRHRKRRVEVALAVDVAVHDHQHVATLGDHTRHGKPQRRGRRLHSPTMADTANLTDTTAIVTGGASGMGEATARRLAAAGATVVILDRDPTKGEKVATDLGGRFVQADVTSEDDVSAAVAAAAALAPLRTCIHCAGIGWAERTINRDGGPHNLESFRQIININLIGTFNVLRLAASAMSANEPGADGERGVIVNTASIAAYDGQIGQAAYAASKGGVVALTLTAARDLSAGGIRVCTIAPGLIDTPLLGGLPQPQREALAQSVLFPKRLGVADDFASLAMEIVRNNYLNGEVIRMDAGIRMPPK